MRLSTKLNELARRLDEPGYPWYVQALDIAQGWLRRIGL